MTRNSLTGVLLDPGDIEASLSDPKLNALYREGWDVIGMVNVSDRGKKKIMFIVGPPRSRDQKPTSRWLVRGAVAAGAACVISGFLAAGAACVTAVASTTLPFFI